MPQSSPAPRRPGARDTLLAAAVELIRTRGYAGTTVDDLCRAAGVTKGAFFHHFASKEALGVAAAVHWSETTAAVFAGAPYHHLEDPLDRVLAYIDFRMDMLTGAVPEFTCLVGTMVQETHVTSVAIRDACDASIGGHAATLVPDIEAARVRHGVRDPGWTAQSLALHAQAVLQGAFILSKCTASADVARDSVAHLRRYVGLLFGRSGPTASPDTRPRPAAGSAR